jgi:predicted membrane protein
MEKENNSNPGKISLIIYSLISLFLIFSHFFIKDIMLGMLLAVLALLIGVLALHNYLKKKRQNSRAKNDII